MTTHKTQMKQHEDKYIHIRKFNLYPLVGLIIFTLLAIGNISLFRDNFFSDVWNCEEESCNLISSDLINIYPLIGEYILISLALISLIALFKGGYNNLNGYDETNGLIHGLIYGLIYGLIFGLIIGLIYGLIFGLIIGLIFGLIIGLIFGLIIGLIHGLIGEFEK